ncbi:MAG: DUF7467 domain-containing protein [Myxococcota bacterium]
MAQYPTLPRRPHRTGASISHRVRALIVALATLLLAGAPSAELVGPTFGFPFIVFDNQGSTAYDADADLLLVLTRPITLRLAADMAPVTIEPTDTLGELLNIAAEVDDTGTLVGGVPGDDLAVTGQVDLDGDGVEDFAGLLLTGEVKAFGFMDSGGTTDEYDFVFELTGGLLATFYAGSDLAVSITSEASDFTGDFGVSFSGEAKGTLGASARRGSLGDFVWDDLDADGLQDLDEPGIEGVVLRLVADTDGDGVDDVELEQTTDADGGYLFDELPLDVEYEVSVTDDNFGPGGALEGLSASPTLQGADPALDSNENPSLVLLTADQPEDPTIDFGYTDAPLPCELGLEASCEVLGKDDDTPDCRGQVKRLVFQYTAEGCDGTTNDQGGKVSCEGGADGATPVDIVVRNHEGEVIGDFGDVATGESIEIADADVEPYLDASGKHWWDWWKDDEGLGRSIEISVDGTLEVVSLDTSCYKPLDVGDAFGSFLLEEITSTRGGTVSDEDDDECIVVGAPEKPHCVGRLQALSFRYLGGSCDEGNNEQGGEARCVGDAGETEPVRVLVFDGRGGKPDFGDDVVDPDDGDDGGEEPGDGGEEPGDEVPDDMADDYEKAEARLAKIEKKLTKARKKLARAEGDARKKWKKKVAKWKARKAAARETMETAEARIERWSSTVAAATWRGGDWGPPGDGEFALVFDDVALGDTLAIGARSWWKLPPQLRVEVRNEDGELIQELLIHTSCSEPLDLGDRFGSLEVVAMDTTHGDPIALGQEVKFTYTVTNPNTFDVFDVSVEDAFGVVDGSPIETLAAEDSETLMSTVLVSESVVNMAVALGVDGAGGECGPADAATSVTVVPPKDDGDSDSDSDCGAEVVPHWWWGGGDDCDDDDSDSDSDSDSDKDKDKKR